MVELDAAAGRILLVTAYVTPGLSQEIRGARFVRNPKPHWTLPLTLEACRAARSKFGRSLSIGPELSAWAATEVAREQRLTTLGAASDAVLQRVPDVSPKLAAAMANRTYQRVAARFAAEALPGGGYLNADEPGLGKTLEAIGGIIEANVPGPYLVLAPKTATHVVWGREIPRWYPSAQVIVVPDGRAKRDAILNEFVDNFVDANDHVRTYDLENTWLVVHPEMMRAKRTWVCPECGEHTPWRAGRKQLRCILDEFDNGDGTARPHPFVDPSKIETRTEYVFPQLFAVEWGAIISDECDKMLIRKTGTPNQTRTGAEELRTRPGGLRIAMSGTPTRGKPQLLWGMLNWIRPKQYTSYWNWVGQHWEVSRGWGESRSIGAYRGGEALDRELKMIMLRRTKAEVAQDMPPKTYIGTTIYEAEAEAYGTVAPRTDVEAPSAAVHERDAIAVWLPMEGEQKRLYDEMHRTGEAHMADGARLDPIGELARMSRLKQFASSAGELRQETRNGVTAPVFYPRMPSNKFDYIMGKLEEMGFPDDPQEKVVITSQFTALLTLFEDAMRKAWYGKDAYGAQDTLTCRITGQVTGVNRERTIDAFNQEVGAGPHVMFLNVKAGGVAITLDTADHMFGVDETWNPDDEIQVEDRIHRVSRPRPVFYHKLRSLGTIEANIAKANAEMAADAREVLDLRRGVAWQRRVMGLEEQ